MTDNLRNVVLAMTALLMLVTVGTLLQNETQRTHSEEISFSQLLNEVEQGHAPLTELLKPDGCRAPPRSSHRAAGARHHQHLARASG
jgi:hypothetical protein